MPSGGRVNCGVSTLRVLARLQHNDVLRAKVARSNRAGQARNSPKTVELPSLIVIY